MTRSHPAENSIVCVEQPNGEFRGVVRLDVSSVPLELLLKVQRDMEKQLPAKDAQEYMCEPVDGKTCEFSVRINPYHTGSIPHLLTTLYVATNRVGHVDRIVVDNLH